MNRRSKSFTLATGLAIGACILTSVLQAQDRRPISGEALTEDVLIQALRPPPSETTDDSLTLRGGGKTRTISVRPAEANRPPGPGSVSMSPTEGRSSSVSILITFATDSADLTPQARRSLDVVGRALNSDQLVPFSFRIEGHADPRGGADYNLRLSQARADAVRQYLVAVHGISATRLQTMGKGDRELLNVQNLIAPENRRVTIVNLSQ